jgi:hypothetical protein
MQDEVEEEIKEAGFLGESGNAQKGKRPVEQQGLFERIAKQWFRGDNT